MSSIDFDNPFRPELTKMIPENISEYISIFDKRNHDWAARKYSPEAYKQWLEQKIFYLFNERQDVYDIEGALVEIGKTVLKPRFLCVRRVNVYENSSRFYYFNDICWVETDQRKACEMLRSEIFDYLKTVNIRAAEFLMNEKFCNKIVERNIYDNLSIPYDKVPQRNYRKFVAANGTLIGDGETGEYFLRPSLPDDLEFSFNDVEVKGFTYDDLQIQTLLTWLNQIFRDRKSTFNFLDNLRTAITGAPRGAIWYGTGDNSKTTMKILVNKVFGDLIKIADDVKDEDILRTVKDVVISNSSNIFSKGNLHHHERFVFKGRWSDVADPDNDVYLRDSKFTENVSELASAFLWLILHYLADIIYLADTI